MHVKSQERPITRNPPESKVVNAKEKFLKEMKSAIQWTYEWQENEIALQLIFRRKYEWPEWKIKQATILP